MADEDLPPPLDDLSDVIGRISALKTKSDKVKADVAEFRKVVNEENKGTKPKQPIKQSSQNDSSQASACGFGGMKKGFLSNNGDGKKSKPQTNSTACADSIPLIKPTAKPQNDLVMKDVQQAMREHLARTDAWLTEDLLSKLGSNDKLMTMMHDPRCDFALQEFQSNPDKALLKYQNDKYIQDFFREFCDVLGNHYENLHDASLDAADQIQSGVNPAAPISTASPTTERREELIKEYKSRKTTKANIVKETEDDLRVKQVLSNPQLREILQSENIMELIRSLKENPEKAQRLLQQGGKEFQDKVKILVDNGLLAFQR